MPPLTEALISAHVDQAVGAEIAAEHERRRALNSEFTTGQVGERCRADPYPPRGSAPHVSAFAGAVTTGDRGERPANTASLAPHPLHDAPSSQPDADRLAGAVIIPFHSPSDSAEAQHDHA